MKYWWYSGQADYTASLATGIQDEILGTEFLKRGHTRYRVRRNYSEKTRSCWVYSANYLILLIAVKAAIGACWLPWYLWDNIRHPHWWYCGNISVNFDPYDGFALHVVSTKPHFLIVSAPYLPPQHYLCFGFHGGGSLDRYIWDTRSVTARCLSWLSLIGRHHIGEDWTRRREGDT